MKHLSLFNEHFEEQLCRHIDDEEYKSWKSREYIKLDEKSISVFKEQISKFLNDAKQLELGEGRDYQEFSESKMNYYEYRVTYNGNPLYGPEPASISPTGSGLKMSLSKLDDEWYLIEAYFNWSFYTFLCDDLIGLKNLADTMVREIEE